MKKIIEYLNNSSFFPYFIITPIPYAIGTAAIDILFGINKAKEKNKKLLIIAPSFGQKILNYQICNDFLFDKILIENFSQEKNFIRIFFSIFINLNFFFFRSISLIILKIFKVRLKESYFFSFIGISQSYEDKVETKEKTIDDIKKIGFFYNKNPIHLSEKFKNDGSKILNKIGCEKNQDFVCLHVREGLFRNDENRRPFRNSNIYNYNDLIQYLINKNIFVIRIGRKSQKPLNIKSKYLFDLPFSDQKYNFFDIFLIKYCKFYIGDQSGPTDTAVLLGKDCLKTNMLRVFELPPTTIKSRTICKLPFYKHNNQQLNLKEYLNLPYQYHHPEFIDNELDFTENSSEDLYNAIEEFWNLIYNQANVDYQLNQIQINFNKDLEKKFEKMYFGNDAYLNNFYRKKLLFKWLRSTQGSYCQNFLKKYYK